MASPSWMYCLKHHMSLEFDRWTYLLKATQQLLHEVAVHSTSLHRNFLFIVLDLCHIVTKLLITDVDEPQLEPVADRVFTESAWPYIGSVLGMGVGEESLLFLKWQIYSCPACISSSHHSSGVAATRGAH